MKPEEIQAALKNKNMTKDECVDLIVRIINEKDAEIERLGNALKIETEGNHKLHAEAIRDGYIIDGLRSEISKTKALLAAETHRANHNLNKKVEAIGASNEAQRENQRLNDEIAAAKETIQSMLLVRERYANSPDCHGMREIKNNESILTLREIEYKLFAHVENAPTEITHVGGGTITKSADELRVEGITYTGKITSVADLLDPSKMETPSTDTGNEVQDVCEWQRRQAGIYWRGCNGSEVWTDIDYEDTSRVHTCHVCHKRIVVKGA